MLKIIRCKSHSQKFYFTFIASLIVLLITSFFHIENAFAYPSYTPNADLVTVGPYDTPASGAGNLGYNNAGAGSRELITIGQAYRIRQNGTISQIKMYTSDISNATGLYFKVWRINGNNRYDRVGTSENLISKVATSTTNTITLSSPITGVQEGDYYGYRVEKSAQSAGQIFFARTGQSNVTSYMVDNASPGDNYNWTALTALAGTVTPIEIDMQAPQFVFIGDSIIAGHGQHYSFLENTASTTNITSTIEKQFSITTGYTYQNMGIGGQNTTQISARFTTDVVNIKPRVVVIEGGVNDLAQGVSKATFIANWTSMLNAAQANNIQVMVLKILPWTTGTNTQMQSRDDWNNSLVALAATYPNTVTVDASSLVGQFRAGGDAGNLWDVKPTLTPDGVHYFQTGHTLIAQALSNTLNDSTAPTILNVTSSTASGSYKTGDTVNITVGFSEAVTSTGSVTVTLNTTPTPRTCTFTIANSTSGSCTYTVQASDTSGGLSVSSITGTISDFVGNVMSNFVPTTNLTASKTILIDTTAPTITSITTSTASGTYSIGTDISLTATFSELVTSANVTLVTNTIPSHSCSFSITNLTTGSCTYSVQTGDVSDGLTISSVSGTIADQVGNQLTNYTPNTNLISSKTIIIDASTPSLSQITATATSSNVTITWTSDESTSSKVDYGLLSTYSDTTTETDVASRVSSHSVVISNLVACTLYHYRVRAKDAGFNEALSGDNTFITIGCPVLSTESISQTDAAEVMSIVTSVVNSTIAKRSASPVSSITADVAANPTESPDLEPVIASITPSPDSSPDKPANNSGSRYTWSIASLSVILLLLIITKLRLFKP